MTVWALIWGERWETPNWELFSTEGKAYKALVTLMGELGTYDEVETFALVRSVEVH